MHKSILLLSLAPAVETRQMTPFSLTTPTQTRSTRWGLAIAVATTAVFLERAAGEQRVNLHCCCLRPTSYQNNTIKNVSINRKRRKTGIWYHTSTSSRFFYSSNKNTWLQYKKPQIQAPGTTFSIVSDEVRLWRTRKLLSFFATLRGVHQGARICLA